MPGYPLLPLPLSERGEPPNPPGFVPPPRKLSAKRQGQRLGPKFEHLQSVLAAYRDGLYLRDDPASLAPERALVMEMVGSVRDFHALVRKVKGLEFLADEEIVVEPDEDFFERDTRKGREGQRRKDRLIGGRLYLAMPDIRALSQILSLWNRWQCGEDLPGGFTQWRDLFAGLRDIRPWGPTDRLANETVEFWRETASDPVEIRRIEAELWFHESATKRATTYHRVSEAVLAAGGDVIDHAVIEEIGYDAALIDLPSSEVARLVEREEIHLVVCDDVMFLRPQSSVDVPELAAKTKAGVAAPAQPPADLPPVAALLDGVPVQNHRLLDGRIEVDDPDGLEAMSVLTKREHGTTMASLILHGDRNLNELPISRRLHVHPVLYAPGNGRREEPKPNRLLVDTIYRAIRRMKEGGQDYEATAPDVFLVNLSLGDPGRPFVGRMSPWGKLLDYLADRYGILFVVSAGNITRPLPVGKFTDWASFEDATPENRECAVLQSLSDNKAYRTLLSPAEAINVVTVGAWHHDAVSGPRGAGAVDPYGEDGALPNVSSALGLGHRKVIKPEIHLPGGREHLRARTSGETLVVVPGGLSGLMAASPDRTGDLGRERLTMGTSAATALATRAAHRLFEVLTDTDGGSMHANMDSRFRAVVIKALLIHRAKWGSRAEFLDGFYGPHGQGKHSERRDNIARLLGYGFPDIDEALSCAPNRATLVGHGIIAARQTNIHRIPLPPSLEKVTDPRSVTVTVAWFSPVNPRHQAYRRAKLEVSAATKLSTAVGVKRSSGQPSDKSVPRGTVFHARYNGNQAVPFVDDGHVSPRVFCREQAGSLDQDIRYGVAVTIEASKSIPVYDEVRARLAVPVGGQIR